MTCVSMEAKEPRSARTVVRNVGLGLLAVVTILAIILMALHITSLRENSRKFKVEAEAVLYSNSTWEWGCFAEGELPCIINKEHNIIIVQVPVPRAYRIGRPGASVGRSLIVQPCQGTQCDSAERKWDTALYSRAEYLFGQVTPLTGRQ